MIVVAASGGFDPLHVGHLEYLVRAKDLGGWLLVIVNSDEFLIKKKGYVFMPLKDRIRIIRSLKCVNEAVEAIDQDMSVCETLRKYKPHVFANGGDRHIGGILEEDVCKELGIRVVDGLGDKIRSSSDLVSALGGLR